MTREQWYELNNRLVDAGYTTSLVTRSIFRDPYRMIEVHPPKGFHWSFEALADLNWQIMADGFPVRLVHSIDYAWKVVPA